MIQKTYTEFYIEKYHAYFVPIYFVPLVPFHLFSFCKYFSYIPLLEVFTSKYGVFLLSSFCIVQLSTVQTYHSFLKLPIAGFWFNIFKLCLSNYKLDYFPIFSYLVLNVVLQYEIKVLQWITLYIISFCICANTIWMINS